MLFQRPVRFLIGACVTGCFVLGGGCAPVTGVALLQNNPELFQLVRRAAEPVQESLARETDPETKKNSEPSAPSASDSPLESERL